jgi:hypothetical protein
MPPDHQRAARRGAARGVARSRPAGLRVAPPQEARSAPQRAASADAEPAPQPTLDRRRHRDQCWLCRPDGCRARRQPDLDPPLRAGPRPCEAVPHMIPRAIRRPSRASARPRRSARCSCCPSPGLAAEAAPAGLPHPAAATWLGAGAWNRPVEAAHTRPLVGEALFLPDRVRRQRSITELARRGESRPGKAAARRPRAAASAPVIAALSKGALPKRHSVQQTRPASDVGRWTARF